MIRSYWIRWYVDNNGILREQPLKDQERITDQQF